MADSRGRMTADPWAELDERLTQLNSLTMPPNVARAKARDTLTDVRSGSGGHIEPVDYRGPVTFCGQWGRTIESSAVNGGSKRRCCKGSITRTRESSSEKRRLGRFGASCATGSHYQSRGTRWQSCGRWRYRLENRSVDIGAVQHHNPCFRAFRLQPQTGY